jgi:hypothetical protein
MVSLRWLKFWGTPLHWPKPSDKCDISLKKKTLLGTRYTYLNIRGFRSVIPIYIMLVDTMGQLHIHAQHWTTVEQWKVGPKNMQDMWKRPNWFSTGSRLDRVTDPSVEVYFLFTEGGGPLPCVKPAFQAVVDKVTGALYMQESSAIVDWAINHPVMLLYPCAHGPNLFSCNKVCKPMGATFSLPPSTKWTHHHQLFLHCKTMVTAEIYIMGWFCGGHGPYLVALMGVWWQHPLEIHN